MQTTAQINMEKKLSPEIMVIIKELAEIIKPLLDSVHEQPKVSKDYYAEYMLIIGKAAGNKGEGYIKLIGLSMLYLGCNPTGLNNAVKFLTN